MRMNRFLVTCIIIRSMHKLFIQKQLVNDVNIIAHKYLFVNTFRYENF